MLESAQAGSGVTAEELAELQAICAGYVAGGGELGEIASEIARISEELGRLCAEADEFLGS